MWTYQLPDVLDDDVGDTLTLTVDISGLEEFATFENGIIQIEDISDPAVPVGTFSVAVTLTDGFEVLLTHITVIIYARPPEFEEEVLIDVVVPAEEAAKVDDESIEEV